MLEISNTINVNLTFKMLRINKIIPKNNFGKIQIKRSCKTEPSNKNLLQANFYGGNLQKFTRIFIGANCFAFLFMNDFIFRQKLNQLSKIPVTTSIFATIDIVLYSAVSIVIAELCIPYTLIAVPAGLFVCNLMKIHELTTNHKPNEL